MEDEHPIPIDEKCFELVMMILRYSTTVFDEYTMVGFVNGEIIVEHIVSKQIHKIWKSNRGFLYLDSKFIGSQGCGL